MFKSRGTVERNEVLDTICHVTHPTCPIVLSRGVCMFGQTSSVAVAFLTRNSTRGIHPAEIVRSFAQHRLWSEDATLGLQSIIAMPSLT